ncbi:MAG TPA: SDR family oxidoreductase [Candidatus Gracilibacteria bacterium]|nr:SDR family oxidoreductase [Candidatus Gracilibacteria bacterium]
MKTAVLTGVSGGLGQAFLAKLLTRDFKVYGIGRQAGEICAKNYQFIEIDLNRPDFSRDLPKLEQVDLLINNAGLAYLNYLENLKIAQIDEMLMINLRASILISQHYLKALKKVQGRIINIGSESALKGEKQGTVYCASKFALAGFSDALRKELAKDGVSVSILNPGPIATNFFRHQDWQVAKAEDAHLKASDLAQTLDYILDLRPGIEVNEIQINPLRRVFEKK